MVLAVFAQRVSVCPPSCLFHEVACCPQIVLVACHPVEFHEGHLDDGVAAGAVYLSFIRTEHFADEVGIPDGHVEQRTFSCRAIVCDGSFVEMAAVVQLVAVYLLPAVCPPPSREARTLVGDAGGQVAVRFLGGGDEGDDAVQVAVQLLVILHGQRVGRSFDDFVGVGVVEREVAAVFAFFQASRDGKVVKTSVFLTFLESRGNGYFTVGLDARCPERVFQVHLRERYFADGSVGRDISAAACIDAREDNAAPQDLS